VSYWVDPRHPEVFDTGELFDGSLHRVLCLPKGDQSWLQVETLHFVSDEDAFIRQKQRFSFLSTTLPFAALDRLERLSRSDESVIHPFFGFRLERHTKSFFELTGLGTQHQLRQKFQPWIRQVKVAGSKEYGATLR
jgi:hypothetical protein